MLVADKLFVSILLLVQLLVLKFCELIFLTFKFGISILLILQFKHVKYAVMYAIIVYNIVFNKNIVVPSKAVNVNIKNIANIIPETNIGHLSSFCRAIENMIVAIGNTT